MKINKNYTFIFLTLLLTVVAGIFVHSPINAQSTNLSQDDFSLSVQTTVGEVNLDSANKNIPAYENPKFDLSKGYSGGITMLSQLTLRLVDNIRAVFGNNLEHEVKIEAFYKATSDNVYSQTITYESAPSEIEITNTDLKPGTYTLAVTDVTSGNVISQEFTWGVLAINTNKSIYTPGETAKLAFAVLNNEGDMVCNALLKLDIQDPQGNITSLTTSDGTIQKGEKCELKAFIMEPDFFAEYTTVDTGTYQMRLTSETADGIYTINDSFEVKDLVAFDVERITATRIYPFLEYPVVLKIKANENYSGIVTDSFSEKAKVYYLNSKSLAQDFGIDYNLENGLEKNLYALIDNGYKLLRWEVNWKAGETYYLAYKYDVPNVSPELYLAGELTIGNFSEARKWQIAADAIGYENASSNYAANTTTCTISNFSVTSANIIVVQVATRNGNTVSGVSDGSAYTSASAAYGSTSDSPRIEQWYRVNPGAGTKTITVTLGSADYISCGAISLTNADTSTPVDATSKNGTTGNGTAPSVSITIDQANSWILSAVAGNNNGAVTAGDASQTLRWSQANNSSSIKSDAGGTTEPKTTSGSPDTQAFTLGSTADWAISAIEVNAAIINDSWTGIAYESDESTPDTTATICAVINNGTPGCDATDASGEFIINNVGDANSGDKITFFYDYTITSELGNTVTISSGSDIASGANLKVYKNHVAVRYETGSSITIAQMATYDNDQNSEDMLFNAVDSTTDTLTVEDGNMFYIPSGYTFAPAGNLESGSSGIDDIKIVGTYTAAAGQTIRVSGTWINTGTFTSSTSTVTFDAASGTEYINSTGAASPNFSAITFNDGGGGATFQLQSAIVATGTFTITSGVVNTGNYQVTFGGTFSKSGTFTAGSSNIVINGTTASPAISGFTTTGTVSLTKTSGTATLQSAVSAGALTINGSGGTLNLGTSLTHTFTGDISLTAGTLNGGSSTLNANSTSATAWNGTGSNFTAGTGTVSFGGANQTLSASATTFNGLTFAGSGTKTLSSATVINGTFSNGSGVTITTGNQALTFGGNFTNSGVALNAGSSSITISGTNTQSIAGFTTTGTVSMTKTGGTATLQGSVNGGALTINGSGGTLNLGSSLSHTFTGTWTRTAGTLNGGSSTLNLQGGLSGSTSTFTAGTGTVNYSGSSAQTVAGVTYNVLKINNSNASGATLGAAAGATTLTIGDATSSVFSDGGYTFTSTGTLNFTAGTYNLGTAGTATSWPAFSANNISAGTTVIYASGVAQNVSTSPTYSNLTFSAAGTKTTGSNTLTITGNWSVSSTTALNTSNTAVTLSGNLSGSGSITQGTGVISVGGDWTNTGTFTASSAGVTMSGSGKQITGPGAGITFTTLTINGTVTNNNSGTLTVSTALSGSGTLTQGNNSTLSIGGTSGISSLDAYSNTNTVNYTGSTQTVHENNYNNLTLSGSNTDILQVGTTSISGSLSISGTVTTTTAAGLSVGNNISVGSDCTLNINHSIALSGSLTNSTNGVINTTSGTPTITMSGVSKTIGGGTTGGITIHGLTVSGSVTWTNGGTNNINGDVLVQAGGTLNLNSSTNIAGSLTNATSGVISTSAGTPTITMSGSGKSIGGGTTGGVTIYALTVSGSTTWTNGGTNIVTSDISVGTGATLNLNSSLSLGGSILTTTTGILGNTSGSPEITMTGSGKSIGGGSGTITFYSLTLSNDGTTTLNSDTTITNTLNITTSDTLSVASGKNITVTSTLTLPDTATISGSGKLIYQSSSILPTTGTISTILRFDATNNNQTVPVRSYLSDVEFYNASNTNDRTITLGSDATTITLGGNVTLNASGSRFIGLAVNGSNPAINISGNIVGTSGGGSENITTGTGTWKVSGDVDLTNIGTFTTTGGTFQMDGSGKSLTSASKTLNNFSVVGGSVSRADAMDVDGNFSVTSGAFSMASGTSNVSIAGNFSLSSSTTFSGNTSGGKLIFNGTTIYTDSNSTKQVVGDVQIGNSPGTTNLASDFSANSLTIIAGDAFNTCNYDLDIGDGGIILNSGSPGGILDASENGTTVSCSGTDPDGITTINNSNKFEMQSGSSFVHSDSSVIMDDNDGTDTITSNGNTFYDLTIDDANNDASIIIQIADTLDVNNNLSIPDGTLDANSGGPYQINVGGNWDNDSNFQARGGLVVFDAGSGTKTIDALGSSTYSFYDIEFNDGVGTASWQLTDNLDSDHNFTITEGTIDANGKTINIGNNYSNSGVFTANSGTVIMDAQDAGNTLAGTMTGGSSFYNLTFDDNSSSGAWNFGNNSATISYDFTITGGSITAPASGYTLTIGHDFTNDDSFSANNGSVIFNTSATSTLSYSGATTFYQFTVSTAGKTMKFSSSFQTNITDTLILQGSDCTSNRVFLDSDNGSSSWNINATGSTKTVEYADIKNSNAIASITAENSTDGGGNTGLWTINGGVCGGPTPTPTPTNTPTPAPTATPVPGQHQVNIKGELNIKGGVNIK